MAYLYASSYKGASMGFFKRSHSKNHINSLKEHATKGNVLASASLGNMYLEGDGVSQNYDEGLKWCRLAAEQGDVASMATLGFIYHGSYQVKRDYLEAFKWFCKAASQGNSKSLKCLKMAYYSHLSEDEEFMRALCENGNTLLKTELGKMLHEGSDEDNQRLREPNLERALELYLKAAGQGHAPAKAQLGKMYHYGEGVPQSFAKAFDFYRQSADQGYSGGQNGLGELFLKGDGVPNNPGEALKWFHKASDQDDLDAKANIGAMHYKGEGVVQNRLEGSKWFSQIYQFYYKNKRRRIGRPLPIPQHDFIQLAFQEGDEKAFQFYSEAADQGDANAQFTLGEMYHWGGFLDLVAEEATIKASRGRYPSLDSRSSVNPIESVRWYNLAAAQGHADAQYRLSEFYRRDHGLEEASKWGRLAAGQGHIKAINRVRFSADQGDADDQLLLGILYGTGKGVLRDMSKAKLWIGKVYEHGDSDNRERAKASWEELELWKY